jgi:TPR repeat protein
MYNLGVFHRDGSNGVAQDAKQAFEWFQKAADLDDPTATTNMAKALLEGTGVTKDVPTGLLLLGRASGLGSEHACYLMGWYHVREERFCGLPKDVQATRKWYLKMATASTRDSPQSVRDEVATWLRENN